MDCLICHSPNYERKYYAATQDGTATGEIRIAPKNRWRDGLVNVHTEAAQSIVAEPPTEACLRCHAEAGGGTFEADDHSYASFKRGSIYGQDADVHADAGLTCSDCHYDKDHNFKRPVNNDLAATNAVVDHQLCEDCHTATPHDSSGPAAMLNVHTATIACTTCHARSVGGAVNKDFSVHIAPNPEDPLGLYKVKIHFAGAEFGLTQRWFNGTIGPHITPLGSKDDPDSKIYPYKPITFHAPTDADGQSCSDQVGCLFQDR